jgi:hypothetical protein
MMFGAEDEFDKSLRGFRPTPSAPPPHKELQFDDSTPATSAVGEGQPQKKTKKPGFFMLHNRIFSSGLAARMGPRPFVLYCWLHGEKNSQRRQPFRASDERIARDTGISPTSLAQYRRTLQALGLIECSRGPSQSYEYTVMDSRDLFLESKPMREKPRKVGKPRGRSIAQKGKPKEELYDGLPRIMFERPTKYAVPFTVSER